MFALWRRLWRQELPGLCFPQSSAHPSPTPVPAVLQFLHSDPCPDLPRGALASEAAAVAPSVQEQREICQKSKEL